MSNEQFPKGPEEGENDSEQEIILSTLARGDVLAIETSSGTSYEITITGVRADGLRVSVRESSSGGAREFTARMPGGFEMDIRDDKNGTLKQGQGITPGVIKQSRPEELNCLYFENIHEASGSKERIARSIRTMPITLMKKRG